MYKGQLL